MLPLTFTFKQVVGIVNPFPKNVYPELKSLRIDFGEGSGCRVHDMMPRGIPLNIRQCLTEAHLLVDALSYVRIFRLCKQILDRKHQVADWLETKMPAHSVRPHRQNESIAHA